MSRNPSLRQALAHVMTDVEQRLAAFYRFPLAAAAATHLVTRNELLASLGPNVTILPEWQARGGVWLLNSDHDDSDVFIGIHIEDEVAATLAGDDPISALRSENLDAFCVVVEEVSHFHLIANRAQESRGVSRLELECQGEIDKLLVCAMTLAEQGGGPHLLPLARLLYDQARIVSAEDELYWQATKHAARFWYDALRKGERHISDAMRDGLVALYHAPLDVRLSA